MKYITRPAGSARKNADRRRIRNRSGRGRFHRIGIARTAHGASIYQHVECQPKETSIDPPIARSYAVVRRLGVGEQGLMRILICEDHPMCREGFVMAFKQAAPDAEIHRVGSLAEADGLLDEGAPFDLVLTDLMLPDSEGLQSLVHFRQRLPNARIAVATGSKDAGSVARARSLGAVGFVPKSTTMSGILLAIRQLIAGEEVFPTDDFADPDDPAVRLLHLTRSQLRMVLAAARGQLNKQIAFDNSLSEATVKAHLAAAFKKLGVTNRVQAGLLVQSLSVSGS